jgi:hypothetical protein
LGEATFVGMGGKEEDAPIPAIRSTAIEPPGSTPTDLLDRSISPFCPVLLRRHLPVEQVRASEWRFTAHLNIHGRLPHHPV